MVAASFHLMVARVIGIDLLAMDVAFDLDHQLVLCAVEAHNEPANQVLTAEFQAI